MESDAEQSTEAEWGSFVEKLRLKYGRTEDEIMSDLLQGIPGNTVLRAFPDDFEDVVFGGWADTEDMAHAVLAAVVGSSEARRSPSVQADIERGMALWRREEERRAAEDIRYSPLPDMAQIVVEVGPYLVSAGLGGIIGNRVDAVFVRSANRLFEAVRDRWRARAVDGDEPLTEEEAVDAAKAAAVARSYPLESLRVMGGMRNDDGSWTVLLGTDGEMLEVDVPPGDLARAVIRIDAL